MYRCLLWGTGKVFNQYINLMRYHAVCKQIEIVGVTSNVSIYNSIYGVPYILKSSLNQLEFDLVVIMADDKTFFDIKAEAIGLGIKSEKILSYMVFNLPNLNLESYLKVLRSRPTIFANNCWAGFTYNHLHLEFATPLINMWESEKDYLKFLESPQRYMSYSLKLKEEVFDPDRKFTYPICYCGDIELICNHYSSFEEVKKCWERRKKRINWKNLFVMMFTADRTIAKRFSELPYKNKICFVPFQTDIDSLCYVEICDKDEMSKLKFYQIVNGMASGSYPYYDDLVLLSQCRIKRICEITR